MIVKELPPHMVYKLHEGDDPNGMMGAMLREASPHINRGRMSAKVIISRETPDRSRDIVVSKGGIFTNHRKIPIACVAHNRNYVAGMAEDPLKNYTVRIKGHDTIEAETYFSQRSELGEQSFRLVEDGVFRGASIGFLPVGVVTKSHAGGNHYAQWELIEYSHLPIPDHPDCIVEAIYKSYSGKALCDPLANILKPMVPERPAMAVSGFASEVTIDGRRYVAADSLPTPEPVVIAPPDPPDDDDSDDAEDARRVFAADTHREHHGWDIVKDDHDGVCEYVVREPKTRIERYRHGKWETVRDWAELHSVPFDSATIIQPVEAKSIRRPVYVPAPRITKTYLQRMRTKAMNPEEDDTLQGGMGSEQPMDDTLPPEPAAEPTSDDGTADLDGMTDDLKPFAQMCHTAHEQLLQITQGLDAALSDTEHPGAAKMAAKVKAAVGKALAAVTAAFADYQSAHPDQPDIPGAEAAPEGMESDEDDDDNMGIPEDDDADGEQDMGDDSELEEDDEPTPKEKAWAQYSVKCLQNYWDFMNSKALAGDRPAMDAAAAFAQKIAADKSSKHRIEARTVVKQLRGGIVTKAITDEPIKAEDFQTLQKQLAALTTGFRSLTS